MICTWYRDVIDSDGRHLGNETCGVATETNTAAEHYRAHTSRVVELTQAESIMRTMVPTTLDRDKIIHELAEAWRLRPNGGSERERRAWANGFREAIAALGVAALEGSDQS